MFFGLVRQSRHQFVLQLMTSAWGKPPFPTQPKIKEERLLKERSGLARQGSGWRAGHGLRSASDKTRVNMKKKTNEIRKKMREWGPHPWLLELIVVGINCRTHVSPLSFIHFCMFVAAFSHRRVGAPLFSFPLVFSLFVSSVIPNFLTCFLFAQL